MNETKASRYQRLRRRTHAADVASGAVLLALLALTPAAGALAGWAGSVVVTLPGPLRLVGAVGVFVGLVTALWEVAALPPMLYLGLSVDRRFRSADYSVEGLLAAQAQATLVGVSAALVAATIVKASVSLTGSWWWLAAGVLLALAMLGAVRSAPAWLPMLAETRPIARASLLSGLRELARRSGVPVSDILEWQLQDDARPTALVAGLGHTRRVFVASEMVRDWSDDEIAVVVAHEIAHHVHRDLWRTLGLNAIVLSAGLAAADVMLAWLSHALALRGPGDLAALPLIGLVTGGVWLLSTPVRHAQSREQERRADRFALAITGSADAFGAAIRRLSARHLTEERPSTLTRWLFHRHPSVAERLELAETFRNESEVWVPDRLPPIPTSLVRR